MVCLNDSEESIITDNQATSACQAFENILPEKSSFESCSMSIIGITKNNNK